MIDYIQEGCVHHLTPAGSNDTDLMRKWINIELCKAKKSVKKFAIVHVEGVLGKPTL